MSYTAPSQISIYMLMFCVFGYMCMYPQHAEAYFEHKYYCTIQSSRIIVDLSNDDGDAKCLETLEKVYDDIQQFNEQIVQTQALIDESTGNDRLYWQSLRAGLTNERDVLQNTHDQIVSAMTDYEGSLFRQVKKVLSFSLRDELVVIQEDIYSISQQIDSYISQGNSSAMKNLLEDMDDLQRKRHLIVSMQQAINFEELAVLVKEYLKVI